VRQRENGRYILEQLITAVIAAICYSEIKWTDGEWIMKRCWKLVPVLLLLVFGAVASGSAMAQRGGHGGSGHGGGYGHSGGYGHGYGYGGGVRFGISLGVPLYGLGYYPAPYYSYPAYAYPAPAYSYPGPDYAYPGPAVAPSAGYVEQGVPQAAPAPAQPQGEWYYCGNSNAYYPYVRECPGGWQRVPAQPPR
jgi:hypothetical protein